MRDVQAFATSFPVPAASSVTLGVGRVVKRDAVVVKVTTECGLVGYGESHHGRAHTTIAHFVNSALRPFVAGRDAADVNGIWHHIYMRQLASHGLGAACAMAMSGIDMALWDIRGKAVGWPLHRLLGGAARAVPAYAGGVALGWQDPAALVEEARRHVEAGYRAVKLRLGDSVARDLARVRAVREAFGGELVILADANTAYGVDDARAAMPGLDELGVGWLEEPFPRTIIAAMRRPGPSGECRWLLARTTTPATSSIGSWTTAWSPYCSLTCPRRAASPRRCVSPRWRRPTSCGCTCTRR